MSRRSGITGSRVVRAGAALLTGGAILTASPAVAHGTCEVTSPSGGAAFTGSSHFASGRIECGSAHDFYSIEVCIQVLRPLVATFTDVACAYSEYSGAGRREWSTDTGFVDCRSTGWYRAQVVGRASGHPSITYQSVGFLHSCR